MIENRPGAGLLVGTAAAANAAPDGYTLLAGLNGNMAVNPSLFSTLPYDPIRDFTPVAMLAAYPFLMVVNKDLPARSVRELIELARAKPGQINYASVSEAGVPGYEYHTWFGLWAPRKAPPQIVELLHAEVRKALSDPAIRDKITAQGGEPAGLALADIEAFVRAEIAKWAEVVRAAGLKVQ